MVPKCREFSVEIMFSGLGDTRKGVKVRRPENRHLIVEDTPVD